MSEDLERLTVERKTGQELFHAQGQELGFDLASFWQWVASDLVSNATRGRLAEYIVARALGLAATDVREEWAAFDLQTPSGIKIEVKSAAYVQSWHQTKLSSIMFTVRKTRAWDAATNRQSHESRRQADIYVFALLSHTDKRTIDPLNVNQWQFYLVPTSKLDERMRSQHSITLKSLEQLSGGAVHYTALHETALREALEKAICKTTVQKIHAGAKSMQKMAEKSVTQSDLNRVLDDWDGGSPMTQEDEFVMYAAMGYTPESSEVPVSEREAYRKYLED